MTIREKNLKKILELKYLENDNITFIDSRDLINSPFKLEMETTFEALEGKGKLPNINLKGYFFENVKFSIELDEILDHNRYRLKTYRCTIYESFPGVKLDKQRVYCKKFEQECVKAGSAAGIWTNKEAERYFGMSEAPGDFGLNGSAGWKLRAYQNFLKDTYAKYANIRLLRISIWDQILVNKQLVKIGDLLNNPDQKAAEHILNFIERRIVNLYSL